MNDYVESINQYSAGQFDGVTATNMDALSIPAAGGVDTTALIVGDYSNGNDGLVMKGTDGSQADQGPEGASGRAVGVALPPGQGARQRRSIGERRQGGEHLGC